MGYVIYFTYVLKKFQEKIFIKIYFFIYLYNKKFLNMIKLPILYKYGNNGKILFWEIIVEGEKYYTRYGVLGGKVIESAPTILKDSEDAMSKAHSMWEHKCKALRYYDSIECAKSSVDVSSSSFRPPMLAKVYNGKYDDSYKFIQPKLDGIRCNCFMKDGDVIALSKNNHEFKQIRHITDSLSDILSKYPSLHLDGELYNHTFHDNFEEAYRLLNYDGLIYIAEPTKSYDETQRAELMEMLKRNGFTPVGNIEVRGKFFYLTVIKK